MHFKRACLGGVFFILTLVGCATTTGQNIQSSQKVGNALQSPEATDESMDTVSSSAPISTISPVSGAEPTIRVLVKGRRHGGRIVKLPIETYLAGVIGNEMSRRWPAEALKAQAVAARSYALYRIAESRKMGRRFDLVSTQADQVFRMRDTKNDNLKALVDETRGEVLSKEGEVVEAFYSSTCGGVTRTAEEAGLSTDAPLFSCKHDNYCARSPFRNWGLQMSLADLTKKFKKGRYSLKNLSEVQIVRKERSGYVKTIGLRDDNGWHEISGDTFRHLLGAYQLKSLLFRMSQMGDQIIITGNGFGHGVGMCQYGAKRMAESGRHYKTILAKYYPRIPIAKIY